MIGSIFKQRIALFILFIGCFFKTVALNKPANLVGYRLDDGTYFQLGFCTENIIRIRTSPNGKFPESLMERYGIVICFRDMRTD